MTRNACLWLSRALVAVLGLASAPAIAEDSGLGFERTPPRLSFVDGEVSYWRPGDTDWAEARVNTALADGDELSTGPGANLELQVGSRAWVRSGEASLLGVTSVEPDFLQLELTNGTAALDLRELASGRTLEIDTPNAAFTIERPGFYRVEIADDATTFTTRRGGRATIAMKGGLPTAIEANERLVVTGSVAPALVSQGAPALDEWDRWNYSRSDQQVNRTSARYVPAGVYGAGDLDEYGAWQRVPSYGAVWVPRVAVGWTPYTTGSWVADPYYGFTWVDDAPWGWAPFHYGRWVYVGGYWGWAPGPRVARAYYSPALVAFYGGSNYSIGVGFGGAPYAGWVALGWGEPVVPWWGPRGCRGQAHWAGWGGPRYVNNIEVNNYTTVNVNNIQRYANADRQDAFVAVDRNRFGHGEVQDGRVSRIDRSRMQPVGGRDLDARPERSMRAGADRGRAGPPADARERRVVTRRDTLEPGMRDASRGRTSEASPGRGGSGGGERAGLQTRERRVDGSLDRNANASRLRQDRQARAERSTAPPTRMARADSSQQRRSVSERGRASRGDPTAGERRAASPPSDSSMRAPQDGGRDAQRTSQRSMREASPAAPHPDRTSPRAESRDRSRAERAAPRQRATAAAPRERREAPRTREQSASPAPRSFENAPSRPQRFEPPARPERQERSAPRERQPEAAPQAAPTPGGGGQEQPRGQGDGGGGERRGGGEGRRSQRGQS